MLPGIGIFGSGTLAHLIIRYLRENGFKIEAIWAPNESDAVTDRDLLNIPFSSTVIDKVLLLPSVQLIVITCPPHFHSQIASKACGIGKHVVCNWPPSYSIKEMMTMKNAAANYPSLITLICTALRFIPAFSVMQKLVVEDQLIGPVKIIDGSVLCDVFAIHNEKSIVWDKYMGGGLLSIFATNMIDIITFVTGFKAKRVNGMVRCFNQFSENPILRNNADDFVSFQMEMYNEGKQANSETKTEQQSVIANITLNGLHSNQYPTHELYVYGTNGYLLCRDGNVYARLNKRRPNSNCGDNGSKLEMEEKIIYVDNDQMMDRAMLNSHIFPKLYLRGIYNMIIALKKAFFGSNNSAKQQCADLNHPSCNNGNDHFKSPGTNPYPGEMVVDGLLSDSTRDEQNGNNGEDSQIVHWAKEPVNHAANFEDGLYIQAVIDAIKQSSEQKEWIRVCIDHQHPHHH